MDLGLASGGAVSKPLGIFLSVWVILLPILLVIFYIMALKDIDIPFFILTCIDTTIVLFWYIGCMLNANTYTISTCLPLQQIPTHSVNITIIHSSFIEKNP